MKSYTIVHLSMLVILVIILTACNMPSTSVATTVPGLTDTQPATTAEAVPSQTQANPIPTIVITPVVPSPTKAVLPTITSTNEPTATPTAAASPTSVQCTNQADFVSDVTIPDDTEVLIGQDLIKTWRLKNTGTCTWTDQYSIDFVEGDQMGGSSPLQLSGSTPPGGEVDISISLKAPGTTGTYRGDWLLKDAKGNKFGIGKNSDQAFYVQVKVVEGVGGLNLGNPTWRDTLDNTDYWYLLDTANTKWSAGDGKLVMKSIKPGGGEEWGLADQSSMKDYYLQATFITGDTCSGFDRFGLLGRSPDPNQGYVFELSCDGHYRIYTWDGKNYEALQEWRTSPSIKTGSGQTNVMGLWMKGSTLKLYVNGFKIGEFSDTKFTEGQFGLVIGSVNTENFTVSVDEVEYWGLD